MFQSEYRQNFYRFRNIINLVHMRSSKALFSIFASIASYRLITMVNNKNCQDFATLYKWINLWVLVLYGNRYIFHSTFVQILFALCNSIASKQRRKVEQELDIWTPFLPNRIPSNGLSLDRPYVRWSIFEYLKRSPIKFY